VLALLTFVPSRYLYTTHGGPFSLLTNVLGSAWGVSLILILVQMPDVSGTLIYVSLIFPVYYMVLSWAITIRYWLGERRRELSLHYELTPDETQQQIVRSIREFVEREIIPVASRLEHNNEYPHAIVEGMKKLGLFGANVPEEYGGLGLSYTTCAMIVEELSRGWMSIVGPLGTHSV